MFFSIRKRLPASFQCLLLKLTSEMSASSEVRFENSLNSLHGAFTVKILPHDPRLPWNEVFYNEWVEEFQVLTIKIDF